MNLQLDSRTNKFPSAANGQGFSRWPIILHGLGLKFGLHLMRGIPRQAVAAKTPIMGTSYNAADIADTRRHLQSERRHVWRGHDQARGAGIL